ncbi:putative DnaK-related protein (molecular chaperone) [Desulfatibacillum aliphaticivorans]|uniref:DnaK-related protein (Molecular chaperone) n=1 Tax=Desulfatibacillum aliphaticivorans TaxID=218208 RepID=B8FHQ4_DESAL|nr:Hsp70 family protein [Desulfatibacillum aliphaticivorans]ACL02471.1 putative DnaK-related protein (molecular chaperone) [Desulfatibacillum aliphaticivorans]
MPDPTYIIGIDLGTTNSVVSYVPVNTEEGKHPDIRLFKVPQLTAPGAIEDRETLPSFVLLPGAHDVPADGLKLPWNENANRAVGAFARDRGAEIPHRLISSSKSWLCQTGVGRNNPILPWGSKDQDLEKMSPVQASAAILSHIRDAWNHVMAKDDSSLRLENQEIFLTVPASFDAVARELTVQAAKIAGLEATLLEEPQAAFYSWIWASSGKWRDQVNVGDLVLVCDLGGGTTDFSLIHVKEEEGDLVLERVAVGDHLLVGGDNMDLTLAHLVAGKVGKSGKKLDAWQMRGLWQTCRSAKEGLLSGQGPESVPISILGRGSGLIAGTIRSELINQEVREILTNGFFPVVPKDAMPATQGRAGMREGGLVYASDPAISKHLAGFLSRSGEKMPTAVLFNGGVMKSTHFRSRVLDLLNSWSGGESAGVRELAGANFDLAVARGAAYYGLARKGGAVRIRGGLGKSYYIGVEAAMPAVPGMPIPMKALCVAPFGMEEGTEADLTEEEFGLIVGESVRFEFLGSSVRRNDNVGTVVDDWEQDIEPITLLETVLEDDDKGAVLPVRIHVNVTEVGTLELWCVSTLDDRRWKLEFDVREKEDFEA